MYTLCALIVVHDSRDVLQGTTYHSSIQQRYDQLPSPQCINITYMNTFVHKLLLFLNDADIRNIVCHLNEAISNLNCLQVSITI